MASYSKIRDRMHTLQDEGFFALVEMICDLEEKADDVANEKDALEKEVERLEAKLDEYQPESEE